MNSFILLLKLILKLTVLYTAKLYCAIRFMHRYNTHFTLFVFYTRHNFDKYHN